MKALTREQLEKRKGKAVRLARDVREDDELADEIENESLEEYAEHRHIRLLNPGPRPLPDRILRQRRKPNMRRNPPKVAELEEQLDSMQESVDDAYERIQEALDPSLTREQVIEKLQELSTDLEDEISEEEGEQPGNE